MEIERQVEACQIRPIIGHQLVDREVSLPNHDTIRIGVSNPAHRPDGFVHAGLINRSDLQPAPFGLHPRPPSWIDGVVPILRILVKVMDGIHPKPIDTSVEPESQHVAHGLLDVRIAPIEVGLLLQVRVIIVLSGSFIESPGRTAKLALPVVRWRPVRLRVSPHVPVPLWVGLRGAALLKPGMLIRGMVRHEVKDDLDASRVSGTQAAHRSPRGIRKGDGWRGSR